ncbi:hypothetical protein Hte_002403 [Hypoxylon texense]
MAMRKMDIQRAGAVLSDVRVLLQYSVKPYSITSSYSPWLLMLETTERFGLVGMQTDDTLGLSDKTFNQAEEDEL